MFFKKTLILFLTTFSFLFCSEMSAFLDNNCQKFYYLGQVVSHHFILNANNLSPVENTADREFIKSYNDLYEFCLTFKGIKLSKEEEHFNKGQKVMFRDVEAACEHLFPNMQKLPHSSLQEIINDNEISCKIASYYRANLSTPE